MTRRSKNSCLKIIACGRGSSSDKDDDLDEGNAQKHSTDKRGWSFRKRSARHQVLNKDIITETPLPGTNTNPEPNSFKLHAQTNPVLHEKLSVLQWPDEVPTVKQDEVLTKNQNEVTIKNEDEGTTKEPDELTIEEQDGVIMIKEDEATIKEQDGVIIRKEDDVTTEEEKDEVTIRKEDEVSLRKEDELTTKEEKDEDIRKGDEVTTEEEKDDGIRIEDEVTTKEAQVTIEKEDEAIPSLAAGNQIPDPVIAHENTIGIELITSTENASQVDSLTTSENASPIDLNVEESIVIVLQAAIRGYLAKRALLKHRSVIKLQAAVRGHLVRDQAVGTLRCVQAIVKMQALVRARRARSSEDSSIEEKLDGQEKDHQGPLVNSSSGVASKTNTHYSSTQKLLSNGFARQLLESTPKKKKIHVKCDSSRPDSSWKWFDRWTSVSSSKFTQLKKLESNPDSLEHGGRIEDVSCEVETEMPAEVIYESADLSSNIRDAKMLDDSEENSITYYADNFDFQGSHQNSSSRSDNIKQPLLVEERARVLSKEQEDTVSQTMLDSTLNESREDIEHIKHSSVSSATEEPDTESKKSPFISRKASNPAFLAAQSKFEDLSLRTISGRSISSTHQDGGLETKSDKLSSPADSVTMDKEYSSITENSFSYDIISECGTELSISSTLDSPYRSEVGGGEFATEATVAEKIVSVINGSTDNSSNLENLGAYEAKVAEPVVSDVNCSTDYAEEVASDMNGSIDNASGLGNQVVGARNDSTMLEPISLHPVVSVLPEKVEDFASESIDSFVAVETPCSEQQQERAALDVKIQLDNRTDFQAPRSSVEGSPITQETPSTQVSVKKDKLKKKLGKSVSAQIRKSPSATKKSPAQPTPDSGARSSTEQLPKEPKVGKRHISFGSAKTDHVKLEPKDSSSTEQLPKEAKSGKRRSSFGSAKTDHVELETKDSDSAEQLPKEPKSGKRRNSFGSAKTDHLELEPKDSSSISLPSYMQATQSARLKAQSNNSPKSRPEVQEKDTIIKKRHSLPGANGKHGSPRVQQLASQKQQSP